MNLRLLRHIGPISNHAPGWWASICIASVPSVEQIRGVVLGFGWDARDPLSVLPRLRGWTSAKRFSAHHGWGLCWMGVLVEALWTTPLVGGES